MGRIASTTNPVALVLAAGLSRRMGTPKSELPWGSTTLLGHTVRLVQNELQWPTVLVQGPTASEIPGVLTVRNPHPERGLAESLKIGVANVMAMAGKTCAIGVFLVDQPFVTAPDARTVWMALKAHEDYVAVRPRYNAEWGHPVLLWADRIGTGLEQLQGDQGLGAWLRTQRDVLELDIRVNDRPNPAWDLDRPEDYSAARVACARREQ